jgi:basic amino acid/polyamine antiporter, APA family
VTQSELENSPNSLVQYFGLGTGVILIISSIIGSGVYKKVAPMAATCESPLIVLLAWVLAGGVTLLGVLSLAEIALLLPHSGGPFVYLHKIYGPGVAYAYGWGSFACIQSASTAAIAYVFAESVNAIYPLPVLGGDFETMTLVAGIAPLANLGVKLLAVGLIVLLTFVNCRGVHQGGFVSNALTIIVVVSIAVIIFANFAFSGGSFSNLTQDSASYPPQSVNEKSFGWMKMLFATMLASFWAFEGWINVGFVGDEIRNPQRNIPRILILGVLAIIGIYVCINASYLFALPIGEIIKINEIKNGIAAVEVIRTYWGTGGVFALSVLIIVTTAGCTNATILTSGRIYYAMAKKGMFFRSAAKIDPKTKVPANALWIFAVWSSLLVFSGSFDQLTDMLVFAQFIFYGLVIAGVYILRRTMPDAQRPYKVIGYPVVPFLFVAFCIGLLVNTLIDENSRRNALFGLVLLVSGLPFFPYFRRNFTPCSDEAKGF